ncbi:Calx-beta domain-containing protein [Fimbriiglobus ruber]|uniref:Hemolysin-type calcium binding protein n=1 Tax=Fimbriiglobus ruber TaxID=1908690 RepID=A0A225DKC6_9BACT|nr:Calx-beta domain-containing protein [Fimbriiglobus ruber]OWK41822.1 hemolysin-type calcium binding protein [Fimbriiglobus ruber]
MTAVEVTVGPIDDGRADGNQTVIEALTGLSSDQRYTISGPAATDTIQEIPATVWISAAGNATKFGPTGPADGYFTITRSYTYGSLAVAYGPPGGTATPGTNYSSPLGGTQTVTFAPGVATETLTLIPTDDNQADGNQSVVEAIAGMTPNQRYTVSGGAVTDTIQEIPATAWISATGNATKFGPTGPADGSFTIYRSYSSGTMAVAYGPPGGTATPGTNYSSPLGGTQTVVFTPGVTAIEVTLAPIDDNQADGNQTVIEALTGLSSNQRYVTSGTAATDTIQEIPATAWITADQNATKFGPAGPSTGSFTIHRSYGSGTMAVAYGPPGGTAVPGPTTRARSGAPRRSRSPRA